MIILLVQEQNHLSLCCLIRLICLNTFADPEAGRGSGPPPPGKSQVAICFLRNTPQVQLLLENGLYGPLGNRLMTSMCGSRRFLQKVSSDNFDNVFLVDERIQIPLYYKRANVGPPA